MAILREKSGAPRRQRASYMSFGAESNNKHSLLFLMMMLSEDDTRGPIPYAPSQRNEPGRQVVHWQARLGVRLWVGDYTKFSFACTCSTHVNACADAASYSIDELIARGNRSVASLDLTPLGTFSVRVANTENVTSDCVALHFVSKWDIRASTTPGQAAHRIHAFA